MLFPLLKSLKKVLSVLGSTGYFQKFIANYANVTELLHDLMNKDNNLSFAEKKQYELNMLKYMSAEQPVVKI